MGDEKRCCETPSPVGPVSNPPGQDALRYRIGTWASFRDAMLERLAQEPIPSGPDEDTRPLQALTTRSSDDPSIALVDAFACVADVLTFYQERIANEGYLRTATERRSVMALAEAIGYTPNPGLAASTRLAFTLDTTDQAPPTVDLPIGLQVQSIPGPGELPQTFETIEAFIGRPAWNALAARAHRPQQLNGSTPGLWLEGTKLRLRPGDALLVSGDDPASPGHERWDFRFVTATEEDAVRGLTRADLDAALDWKASERPADGSLQYLVLRGVSALFGNNAPAWDTLNSDTKSDIDSEATQWPGFALDSAAADPPYVDLDGRHPHVVEGGRVVLVDRGSVTTSEVVDTALGTAAQFFVAGPYTRVYLDAWAEGVADFDRRTTVAWIESEALPAGDAPIDDPVSGKAVELDRVVDGLFEGQALIFAGPDPDGEAVTEVAFLDSVSESDDGLATVIHLTADLVHAYERTSLVMYGNAVLATHGETHAAQVLGSGNASATFQRFPLRRSPLTFVSAPTPSGGQSTLEVRVNGVLWGALDTLFGQDPTTEGCVLDIDDDEVATVRFGDGVTGARLPTGVENVLATYRTGLGAAGNVGAHSLRLLKSKPLGLKKVDNPAPATGGTDADSRDATRRNAPLTVLTLDRLVSRSDFEDFALAFAGIDKALAVEVWSGQRRLVHVTVVGGDEVPLLDTDAVWTDLEQAIDKFRDPTQGFVLGAHRPAAFRLAAEVLVDDRYVPDDVLGAAEQALRDAFAFEARALAQAVTSAEVITVLQGVDGVVAVDLDALYRTDTGLPPSGASEADLEAGFLAAVLVAGAAERVGGALVGAELLLLDDDAAAVDLSEMVP